MLNRFIKMRDDSRKLLGAFATWTFSKSTQVETARDTQPLLGGLTGINISRLESVMFVLGKQMKSSGYI
jgi:hypothetical protein